MDSLQKILSRSTTKPAKATFKSFLPTTNGGSEGNADGTSSLSLSSSSDHHGNNYSANNYGANMEESFVFYNRTDDDDSSEIIFHQGEIMICRVADVSRTLLYSTVRDEPLGTLYVTNFRVIFVLKNQSPVNESKSDAGRCNKLIGREDVALSNIFGVYQVSRGRKRKLLPNTYMSGIVKRLQLHCKDFQLHQFCFKRSFQDHVKVLVNAILHHFCPVYVEKLFAFSCVDCSPDSDASQFLVTREYMTAEDWHFELKRLCVDSFSFSVSHCNRNFVLSDSLPECFVLPTSLTSAELVKADLSSDNGCFPVWSYSHTNGCALIRMAYGRTESEDEMFWHVSRSHPKLNPPSVVDLGCAALGLPSLRKLQVSFEELMEICMPSTYKELVNNDSSWFTMLDQCQWLYHVACTLSVASDVAQTVALTCKSVVIKERDGTDFNPLISSLVQLLLDADCRKVLGFQALVEREFVALGHKFSQRCHVVSSKDTEQGPVFLLFLDCTWQLLQQFPSSFEFTEIFLISLWDSVGLGLFRNFIFEGPKERANVEASSKENPTVNQTFPASVWDWRKQFHPEDIAFYTNPLYSAGEQFRNLESKKSRLAEPRALVPCCVVAGLRFWENCFLRWLAPIQIVGGGKPSEIVAQGLIMEDITSLQTEILRLESNLSGKPLPPRPRCRRADKFIFGDPSSVLRRELSKHVSSSYPFSPTQVVPCALLLPVPSPDSRSSMNEDSVSVDELTLGESNELFVTIV